MTLDDWLLALHLLAAATLVAAMVMFSVLIVAARRVERPPQVLALAPLMRIGSVAVVAGSLGVVVFGVWLAIALDAYQVWDGWVIAAIILWAIGSETGRRSGPEYAKLFDRAKELQAAGQTGPSAELKILGQTHRGALLHAASSLAVVLLLIDMIWKPGA